MKTKNKAPGAQVRSKIGILDHIEKIIEIVKNEGFENNKKLDKHADYVSKKLEITPLQAVLFSLFMEKNSEPNITMQDIAKTINCNNIKILKYANEIEVLESKRLIRCSRSRKAVTYRVPFNVCESLRKNNKFKLSRRIIISIAELFAALEDIFDERGNDELTFDSLYTELYELINQNRHLQFCKKIRSYKFGVNSFVLMLLLCHLSGNNDDDNIRQHDYEFLFDDRVDVRITERHLSREEHELFQLKLVEHNYENGFVDTNSLKLTDKAKKELLSELGVKNKTNIKNLTLFEKIKPKKMHYNQKEAEAVKDLTSLLQEENFQKILNRLDKKGMRKGFACLFSGPPGTGKTETAYQIAKETGRNILLVDISEAKSCWFGESEKRVKKIFDDYRDAVDNSKIAPILVLNEADAIISKRRILGESRSGPDQTENAIQNIILQEMENLNGILIATTNLTQNMDSAFERRFLYKIVFNKPSFESRVNIWKSMLPDLSEATIKSLSGEYDLSGGQIENITRKIEVDAILKGEQSWIDSLNTYCKEEVNSAFNSTERRIGFNV